MLRSLVLQGMLPDGSGRIAVSATRTGCPPRTRQFLVLSQCICRSGKTKNEGKQAELITDFMYSNISFVIANLMNIVYHSQQNRDGKVGLVTTSCKNMQAQSLVDSFDASPAPAI